MYAIELLVSEHENVLRLCRAMRGACLNALESRTVAAADFRAFLRIIREYADRHHHGKEEQLLFQEMEERLGPAAQKLVRSGMLVEHDLGRLYAGQLDEALGRWEQSTDRDSLLDILTNAMAYADLLGRHIDRENGVVYRFAENNLPSDVLADLNERTRKFEEGQEDFLSSILAELTRLERTYAR